METAIFHFLFIGKNYVGVIFIHFGEYAECEFKICTDFYIYEIIDKLAFQNQIEIIILHPMCVSGKQLVINFKNNCLISFFTPR